MRRVINALSLAAYAITSFVGAHLVADAFGASAAFMVMPFLVAGGAVVGAVITFKEEK